MGISEKEFRVNYGKLVAATWSNPDLVEKLRSDPHAMLEEFGLPTTPKSDVRVVEMKVTGKGKFEDQWDDWQAGAERGVYDLWLPAKPDDIKADSLSDVNTTCTPCCCCT